MLYDANAATARLKSFPNRTYKSLMCCSSTWRVLHELRASSSCFVDTSRRVTADSTAGYRGRCIRQDWMLICEDDKTESNSHAPSRCLFHYLGRCRGHSLTRQLTKWTDCRILTGDFDRSLLKAPPTSRRTLGIQLEEQVLVQCNQDGADGVVGKTISFLSESAVHHTDQREWTVRHEMAVQWLAGSSGSEGEYHEEF